MDAQAGAGQGAEKDQHLYKVLVLGDYAVGKTSLIRRYVHGTFSPSYKLTIGVDFAHKKLEWNDDTIVNLQLWDIAGHERFGCMTSAYYKWAIAAVIVFDVSRTATFDAVLKWREDLNSKVVLKSGEPIPALLIANKCDLAESKIDKEKLDEFVQKNGFIGWFATSAQDNTNIDDAMRFLVAEVLNVAKENAVAMQPPEGTVKLQSTRTISALEPPRKADAGCCS